MIEAGNIIKNLTPLEAVTITKIRRLGKKYSLEYTGVNTNKSYSRILTEEQVFAFGFINTLKKRHLKIQMKFTAESTSISPLTENAALVKSIEESAPQLGLEIEFEEG